MPIIAGLQPYRFTAQRLTQIDGLAPPLDLSIAKYPAYPHISLVLR